LRQELQESLVPLKILHIYPDTFGIITVNLELLVKKFPILS